jgi:hypothetical protein
MRPTIHANRAQTIATNRHRLVIFQRCTNLCVLAPHEAAEQAAIREMVVRDEGKPLRA